MNEYEKDKNEFGEYIDVKIGKEHKENPPQHSKMNNFEEEMLIMSKRQIEYIMQINNERRKGMRFPKRLFTAFSVDFT